MSKPNAKRKTPRKKPAKKKKARKKPTKKMGRPRKEIDLDKLHALRRIGCTDEEIACVLDTTAETLRKRKHTDPDFLGAYKKGFAEYQVSLRRRLDKAAWKSTGALIFLCKNVLGMQDKPELPPPAEEDEEDDWTYRTRLANGDTMVIRGGSTFHQARDAYIRSKRSKESDRED